MNYKVKKKSIYSFKEDKTIVKTDYTAEELDKNFENQDIKFTNFIN